MVATYYGGWASNSTTYTSWSNAGTGTQTPTTWPSWNVYTSPPKVTEGWFEEWLDRFVKACRARRRSDHLHALRSKPYTSPIAEGVQGLSKTLRWLTRIVRKGA